MILDAMEPMVCLDPQVHLDPLDSLRNLCMICTPCRIRKRPEEDLPSDLTLFRHNRVQWVHVDHQVPLDNRVLKVTKEPEENLERWDHRDQLEEGDLQDLQDYQAKMERKVVTETEDVKDYLVNLDKEDPLEYQDYQDQKDTEVSMEDQEPRVSREKQETGEKRVHQVQQVQVDQWGLEECLEKEEEMESLVQLV